MWASARACSRQSVSRMAARLAMHRPLLAISHRGEKCPRVLRPAAASPAVAARAPLRPAVALPSTLTNLWPPFARTACDGCRCQRDHGGARKAQLAQAGQVPTFFSPTQPPSRRRHSWPISTRARPYTHHPAQNNRSAPLALSIRRWLALTWHECAPMRVCMRAGK